MTRKLIYILAGVIFIVASYLLATVAFPKSTGRIPVFAGLLLMDVYLWFSIKKKVFSLKPLTKYFISILYWLPVAIFVVVGILSVFLPIKDWDPIFVTYLFGAILTFYASKVFAIVFFLIADAFKIIHFAVKFLTAKKRKKPFRQEAVTMNRAKFLKTLGLAGGGVLFSGMVIGIVKWAYDFRVRREFVKLSNLPRAFNGLRIVQISDLHLGSWASKEPLQEAVQLINDLDADVVLFTGDLVNSTTDEAFRFQDVLRQVKAREGVFAVLGNHDYGEYVTWPDEKAKEMNMQKLFNFYKKIGWKLLSNENHILKRGQEKVAIVGVENWGKHRRFQKLGDISKALKGTEDSAVKILMTHDPTHWEEIVQPGFPEVDITFSGHTHGFQFGVEFKKIKWSLAQYVYKYWAGLYSANGHATTQYLYVNRGLGMIGYPGRIGILPEITLITLEA